MYVKMTTGEEWVYIIISVVVVILVIYLLDPIRFSYPPPCTASHPMREIVYTHGFHTGSSLLFDFNPSIIPHQGGYLVAVRRSNTLLPDISTGILAFLSGLRSYINIVHMDAHFRYMHNKNLDMTCAHIHTQDYSPHIFHTDNHLIPNIHTRDMREHKGFHLLHEQYEDPRICIHEGRIYIVVTRHIWNWTRLLCFPFLMRLDADLTIDKVINISTQGFDMSMMQKNWCPFSHRGRLLLHTDAYPIWRVRTVDVETGKLTTVVEQNSSLSGYTNLRCTSSWVSYRIPHRDSMRNLDMYICALHTKSKKRVYRTLLVGIDSNSLLPVMCSSLLCLHDEHKSIQFASGLLVKGDDLYITMGVNDTSFHIVKIPHFMRMMTALK